MILILDVVENEYVFLLVKIFNPLNKFTFKFVSQELSFDPNKSMRNKIYIAHCVPHTCDTGDVSQHVTAIIGKISQKKITTNVGTVKCQTKIALPWTWGDYSFLYVPSNIHKYYTIDFLEIRFYCEIDTIIIYM